MGLLCLVDMVAALNLDPLWHDSEELKIAPYDTHHNQHRNHQRQAGRQAEAAAAATRQCCESIGSPRILFLGGGGAFVLMLFLL